MRLVIFTGINHHFKTWLFGSALFPNETDETYIWALRIVKEMLGDIPLRTVVMDGDKAMRKAIANVFPYATHRLCAWHLSKNITGRVKNRPDFEPRWKKLVTAEFEPEEFEEKWNALVEECELQNNQWVSKKLFGRRNEWADTYLRSHFFAGLTTTSRCESINAVVARRCSKNRKSLDTLPEPSKLGDESSFSIRYGSLQFMSQRFCLLGADTPLSYRMVQDELTAVCNKLEMVKKTPSERERIVLPDKFKEVLNPNQVRFKGCRKGKRKKQLKKKRRKCGNCGLRDGHYRSTCTNPPADVVESQYDEEDDDDGDDDGDDGEDGDDDDGDDDQGGQPPKKQRTSRHNTTGEPIGKRQPQQKIGARTRSNTSQQEKGAEKGAKKYT
ncbi:unnamed protein product [Linum trigynum]|uniref:MULE transposase domain-containing protein n=1 Tax=Linum trigynum TaxID=586398 RepID=A0AAV2GL82_9ROSI